MKILQYRCSLVPSRVVTFVIDFFSMDHGQNSFIATVSQRDGTPMELRVSNRSVYLLSRVRKGEKLVGHYAEIVT